MGTLYIEEYSEIGGSGTDGPIPKSLIQATKDATTSTTPETITTNGSSSYISVYAVEDHRISIGGNETADGGDYSFIAAGERRDLGLHAGAIAVYYRKDVA